MKSGNGSTAFDYSRSSGTGKSRILYSSAQAAGEFGPAVACFSRGQAPIFCAWIFPRTEARNTAAVHGQRRGIAADVLKSQDMEAVLRQSQEFIRSPAGGAVAYRGSRDGARRWYQDDETLDWQFGIVFRHALLALAMCGSDSCRERWLFFLKSGTITLVGSRAGLRAIAQSGAICGPMKARPSSPWSAAPQWSLARATCSGQRGISRASVFTPRVKRALSRTTGSGSRKRTPGLRRMADPADIAIVGSCSLSSDRFTVTYLAKYLVLDGAGDNNMQSLG